MACRLSGVCAIVQQLTGLARVGGSQAGCCPVLHCLVSTCVEAVRARLPTLTNRMFQTVAPVLLCMHKSTCPAEGSRDPKYNLRGYGCVKHAAAMATMHSTHHTPTAAAELFLASGRCSERSSMPHCMGVMCCCCCQVEAASRCATSCLHSSAEASLLWCPRCSA